MKTSWILSALLLSLLAASVAHADAGVDDLKRLLAAPEAGADSVLVHPGDDGVIRITPDTTRIVRLDQDAVSVIVANPVHAAVMLDSPRLLIVMPRQPGATSFTVLGARGETIMTRTVIVSGTSEKHYVRVRRACSAADTGCVPYAYYYCPDGCYEVTPVTTPADAAAAPPAIMGGSGTTPPAEPIAEGLGAPALAPPAPPAPEPR